MRAIGSLFHFQIRTAIERRLQFEPDTGEERKASGLPDIGQIETSAQVQRTGFEVFTVCLMNADK